jgi:hypothetical protein
MKKATIILTLVSVTMASFADRGTGKKSKVKTALNITTPTASLKSSILSNIKSNGLSYKGSLLSTRKTGPNTVISSSLMTYQKGNTTYIIPYKNKVTIPEMKQGYTGVKLIIRSNK